MMLSPLQTLEGHTDRVWTLSWNPAGTVLATSGADKTIRLWAKGESEKWICVSILTEAHNKSIRRLCWSPCGNYLASASFDSTVCIWKRQVVDGSWSTLVNLEGHESEVKSVAWSSDGNYLASCGRDRTIWIWERAVDDNENLEGTDIAENWDCSDVKNDHTKDVKHIVWHPHHPILASCSYDDSVKLFHKHGDDWACFETLNVHTSTVWSADFSATGQYLVTCSDDKTVRVWKNHSHNKLPIVEANSWKCVSVIQGYHSRSIYDVSWSKVDSVFASASGDNSIAIYNQDLDESKDGCDIFACSFKLNQAHDCDVNSISWNPRLPGLLATGGDDRKVKLWSYDGANKGTRPLSLIDELIQSLDDSKIKTNTQTPSLSHEIHQSEISPTMTLTIESFQELSSKLKKIQLIKEATIEDDEKLLLRRQLDLTFTSRTPQIVDISGLDIDNQDGYVNQFSLEIIDIAGVLKYKFNLSFGKESFTLKLPRRSVRLTSIESDILVIDKTGDLYRLLTTGEFQLMLGHLFTFSDLQFMLEKGGDKPRFVLSADRDEKIRVSNYPDTHNIERYCFGHKSFIRRILVIDDSRFISIDQQNEVCVWNLDTLSPQQNALLNPERTISLGESAKKRVCVR